MHMYAYPTKGHARQHKYMVMLRAYFNGGDNPKMVCVGVGVQWGVKVSFF
jgi:hypothetical protein